MSKNISAPRQALSRRMVCATGVMFLGACSLPRESEIEVRAPSPAYLARNTTGPILTFDDGPHETLTPRLLTVLKTHNLKATFFLVGERVLRHPGVVRQIQGDGHVIANHSFTHPNLTELSIDRQNGEIERTQRAIQSVTGQVPQLFRPPYGAITSTMQTRFLSLFGLRTVMWDVDTRDYQTFDSSLVARRVLAARASDVVLLHDIHQVTLSASYEYAPRISSFS